MVLFPDFSNSKLFHDAVSRHGMLPVFRSGRKPKRVRTINLGTSHLLQWHAFPSVPYLFMDSTNEPVPCGTSEELFQGAQMGVVTDSKMKKYVLLASAMAVSEVSLWNLSGVSDGQRTSNCRAMAKSCHIDRTGPIAEGVKE